MYNEKLESLIKAALADGVLTEKEKQVLFKRAQEAGIDLDEFEMVLDARLVEMQKAEKEKAQKSAPKSDKYGSVRKCPICTTIVGAFQGVCPGCGFEFGEVDANLSSKRLHDTLMAEKNTWKKIEIIETFPLPNTKADLLEFLTALKPRVLDTTSEFASAYHKKYAECIEKAKVTFPNDKQLLPFINDFGVLEKRIRKNRIISLFKKYWIIIILLLIILIWIISGILTEIKENELMALREQQIEQFEEYIRNKDAESAKATLKEISGSKYDEALVLIELYIANNDVENAIYVYEKLTPKHCSTYGMKWGSDQHGSNKNYEIDATSLIYKALINSERMEEAWKYHKLEYETSDYIGNAPDYFSYMNDVVFYYCKKNKKNVARTFVKDHLVWFVNNVDNNEWKKDQYSDYTSTKVNKRFMNIINNY